MVDPAAWPPPDPSLRGWRRLLAVGRGRWWSGGLALLFFLALLAPDPGPIPRLRYLGFDSYQALLPRIRHKHPVAIIAIDDRSLAGVGQWPWPRDTMARLLDRVAARSPAVIGLDIVFSEPDRTSPERLAQQFAAAHPELSERLRGLAPHDQVFADALRRAPVVVGVIGSEGAGSGGEGFAPARFAGPTPMLQAYRSGERSLPEIDQAASGRGLFNAGLDNGVVRRIPLVAMVGAYPLLSLSLECLRVAAQEPFFSILSDRPGPLRLLVGDLEVPVQEDGSVFVHYAGHPPPQLLSAIDVLQGRDDPDVIAGHVALIGVTGQGLVDYQLTPNGERRPGVEIHAEVIENIYDGSLLYRPTYARAAEALAFGVLALLAVLWLPRVTPWRAAGAFLASAALLLGSGVALYAGKRWLFDPLTPLLGLTLVHATLLLATMVTLELRRRMLSLQLAREREAAARTAGEMEAARRVQTGMLPKPAQVLGQERRVDLFAHMDPAREVGGDLYDFFYLDDRRLFAAVGDVAGKGLAAALFMAVSKALTKSSGLRGSSSLGPLLERINVELARDNPDELFVTLLAVVLDLDSGEFEYCNAGHEPLLVLRGDGRVEALDEGGGAPLCVFESGRYAGARGRLQAGEWLALVSDGLTEAIGPAGSLFGRDALRRALAVAVAAGTAASAGEAGEHVLAQVRDFEAGVEPADDQTLVLLRWRGLSER